MFPVLIFLALITFARECRAQVPSTMFDQMSTADRLKQPGWWPTKPAACRDDYAGSAVCADCHATLVKGQNQHSMAHTAMLPTDSPILALGKAKYENGAFSYEIHQQNGREVYSVTDGIDRISTPLLWAFGSGNLGQSYLFERDGNLFEARMSFLPG